ncbi:amidohydrolase family protein [Desulfosporosinus sp. PR]|uniref:amidohydrolase family protein n=1 Tax=Candidatus Desulfosporosinus nitrosoreducens TaxID=3401928 RepID=UPI0027F66604|nr:amidohydrolase family protein [Desulfosporosinus sp. PR]MDQ7093237.1 amidohydrolase family protein [Desulfosporosinus sp. PR]
MIVDSHFHIDETMLTIDEQVKLMETNGITKAALIAPFNTTMFSAEETPEGKAGLDYFRQLLLDGSPDGFNMYNALVEDRDFVLGGQHFPIYFKPDNACVEKAIARYPGKFYGWVTVNPNQPEAMREVETYLTKPGFIGVKAHPFMHQYSIKALDEAAAFCSENKKPMLIHLSAEKGSYQYLPEKYPELKVIYAHLGVPHWKNMWEYVKDKANVFLDTSSDYLTREIVAKGAGVIDYRKLIFGNDGPYGCLEFNHFDFTQKKGWIETLKIPDSHKECIFGKNFMELIS